MAWFGSFETSVAVIAALRSPSALSHAEAAQVTDIEVLAATAESHGVTLKGATFPYCKYTVWFAPTSAGLTLPDCRKETREGRRMSSGADVGPDGTSLRIIFDTYSSVAQSTYNFIEGRKDTQ